MFIISAAFFLLLLTFHLIIADQHQPAAIHRQRNRGLDGSWRRNRMAHKTTADVGESELWSSSSGSREVSPAALDAVQSMEEPESTGGGDEQMGSSGPRFLAGAWGPCSASCGPGIRSRPVDCMAPQPISGQLLKLPDYECQQLGQPQPGLFQACQLAACPPRAAGAQSAIRSLAQPFPHPQQSGPAFRWEHGQWTLCSASCLGGRQKSPVLCLELATGKSVAWAKCQQEAGAGPKPEELIRGCNRHSCPPDWEIGPWSACSHSCGGGLRTRRVRCARAVSRTGASTLILPDAQCPGGQRPADEEPCGMVDCAPEWTLGHWGQCSSSCGPGEQRRTLSCLRRDSMGQVQEKQPEDCVQAAGGQKPPATTRLCNLGPCPAAGQRQSDHHGVETEKPDAAAAAAADPAASSPLAYSEPSGPAAVDPRPPPPPQSLALLGPAKDQPVMEAGEEEEQEMADEESEQRKAETLMEPGAGEEEGRQPRRLTLRVGGFANLYEGTSLKVKCPTQRNGDGGGNANNGRRKIEWTKNGHPLRQSARVKVSVNGALRIFRARQKDAGIYACQTTMATAVDGRQQRQQQQMGNVTLRFKPNPAGGGRSGGGGEENRTGRQAAKQLLQRIRDSLYRLGEHTLYHRLASVHDPGQVRVDFAVSDWGQCEQPDCNQAEGIQIRQLKCQLHVGDEAAYLEQSICEAFGVPRPPASRPCTDDGRCPRWTAGPWSDCDGPQSRCVRQATALQRREVRCTFGNGTETSPGACPRKSRPKLKRECQNANCSAEWRPSVWGKCSKRCGDGGVQMRLLRCVWRGTRKPAGPNCERGQRPPAIRACQAKRPLAECPVDREEAEEEAERANETGMMGSRDKTPIFSSSSHSHPHHDGPPPAAAALQQLCEDQSRFCDILRLFQTCDQPRTRAQCCFSCRRLEKEKAYAPNTAMA